MSTSYQKIKMTINIPLEIEASIWVNRPDNHTPIEESDTELIMWGIQNEEQIEEQIVTNFIDKQFTKIRIKKI